jgi:hypothetical protein
MSLRTTRQEVTEGREPTSSGPHPYVGGELFISVKAVEWVLENSKSTGNARNILLVIAAHTNSNGYCWPSFDRIMKLSNCSRPTVSKCIQELDDLEELEICREEGKSNFYSLPKFMEARPVNTSKEIPRNQLSFTTKLVKAPLLEEEVLEESKAKEVDSPHVREDPKQVYKECKRYYRRLTGKSPGNVPPSRGDEWVRLIEEKTGDKILEAFKLWAEEIGKERLRDFRWPMAVFLKNINEQLEAVEDKKAGEQDAKAEEEEFHLPRLSSRIGE